MRGLTAAEYGLLKRARDGLDGFWISPLLQSVVDSLVNDGRVAVADDTPIGTEFVVTPTGVEAMKIHEQMQLEPVT